MKCAHCLYITHILLVCQRSYAQVCNIAQIDKIIRLWIKWVVQCQLTAKPRLISLWNDGVSYLVKLRVDLSCTLENRTWLEIVNCVSLVGESINSHWYGESYNLGLINGKLLLKCVIFFAASSLCRILIDGHCVEIGNTGLIRKINICMSETQ